jgi:hypothetical protein
MCKEHLGVALALRVPVFFVVTKVDLAPEHVLKHTLSTLQQILKKPGVRKRPFLVRGRDDVLTCARHMHADSLAPIFLTSSVTGQGLDLIRLFYSLLPQRHNWCARGAGRRGAGAPCKPVLAHVAGSLHRTCCLAAAGWQARPWGWAPRAAVLCASAKLRCRGIHQVGAGPPGL